MSDGYERDPIQTEADDPQRWWVFDPGGRLLGRVEIPRGLTIHQIRRDDVVGVFRDRNRVEQVRIHRILKSGG